MAETALSLEYIVTTRHPWGLRIAPDGQVEEYSDKFMTFEDGKIIEHTQPLEWRSLVHLQPQEMDSIADAIHKSGFFDLPDEIPSPRQVHDLMETDWHISLQGQEKRVHTLGSEASNRPALRGLIRQIQQVIALAQQAARNQGN